MTVSINGTTGYSGPLGTLTVPVGAIVATGTPSSANFLRGDGSWTAVTSAFQGVSGQVFTSSGTFTVPAGVTAVKVSLCGGGGNGGTAGCSYGGGGGAAGVAIKYITGLTAGGTVTVTVGNAGQTSSFGAYCSATGGGTGGQGTSGTGGAGSGGDLNYSASVTGGSVAVGGTCGVGNLGYGSLGMFGGCGGNGYNVSATGYGNGGGGSSSGTTYTGTKGIVIVEW